MSGGKALEGISPVDASPTTTPSRLGSDPIVGAEQHVHEPHDVDGQHRDVLMDGSAGGGGGLLRAGLCLALPKQCDLQQATGGAEIWFVGGNFKHTL